MPFAKPAAPSGGIDFKELLNALLVIDVLSVEEHVPTVHSRPGEKSPAVKADVYVLDGPSQGEEHLDTLIFPKILQSQLGRSVGEKVIGRLTQGTAKPGQSAPWMLAEATAADNDAGEKWLASRSTPALASAQPPF